MEGPHVCIWGGVEAVLGEDGAELPVEERLDVLARRLLAVARGDALARPLQCSHQKLNLTSRLGPSSTIWGSSSTSLL